MQHQNRAGAVCFYQITILYEGESVVIWQKGILFSESENTIKLDTPNFPPTGTELKTFNKSEVIVTDMY